MQNSFLPINCLLNKPYSVVLGYPKATKKQLTPRLNELKKLGIKQVSFQGDMKLGTINVLGKGYVGVVILAKKGTSKVALKIRRMDSQRKELQNEAKLLGIANKVGVGPKVIVGSKNFLVMEYLSGKKIGSWIEELQGKGSSNKLRKVIRKILKDCHNLDLIPLDHSELSSISKHVIVGKKTTIIDFESASTNRKVSNVTAATQALFIGSGISKKVKKVYKTPSKKAMIKVLRAYKNEKSHKNFKSVLQVLKV